MSSNAKVLPPPVSLPALFEVHPRPLLPLQPPPAHRWLYPPVLPSPTRQPAPRILRDLYELSTHIIPAAFPRSFPFVPVPSLSSENPQVPRTREERKEEVLRVANKLSEESNKYVDSLQFPGDPDGRLLWNVANRYLRKGVQGKDLGGKKRLTLLLFHANGFPKEIWEPTIAYTLEELRPPSNDVVVDEIWSFEAVQHGDAALINDSKLGSLYTWADNSRDILNFLLHYLPDAKSDTYSIHLPEVPNIVGMDREKNGFSDREIVAIGHSFGACSAALAATQQTALFNALILVDPVIVVPRVTMSNFTGPLVLGAVQRRDKWPSLEDARKSFEASPFFRTWDPAVLDVYLECGLTKIKEGGDAVRLKMPGIQEGVVFLEPRVSYETFHVLNTLDERIQIHWVLGGKEPYFDGDKESRNIRVWRRPVNCSNVEITTAAHLVPQEAPHDLALEICKILRQRYSRPQSTSEVGKAKL